MVHVLNPRLGETVLDPACGTGGFLVESYSHLAAQVSTVEDRAVLQTRSLFGFEAKPLPYLLGQMNLLLHGLDAPQIDPGNALRFKLTEIGEKDRFDVILTNPPFGGAEEKGIQGNFPNDLRTTETSLLFMQLILRRLNRHHGRAAVIVPDGFLSNRDVASRIKRQLIEEANLHTVVRLPFGVFEPYTPIKTNVLFFDRQGTTKDVWFYEVPIVDGRKKYTKTRPLAFEELSDCLAWWGDREEGPSAWRVAREEIAERDFNLDFRNPTVEEDELPSDPVILAEMLVTEAREMLAAAERIRTTAAEWDALA